MCSYLRHQLHYVHLLFPTYLAPVTAEPCSSNDLAPAVLVMFFITAILLLVVAGLAIPLVLVGIKFRQLRKKTKDVSTPGGHHACT